MKIVKKIEATAGDNVPAEYSYWSKGKIIGYWAYGSFDPNMPYQGRDTWLQRTTAVMWLRFRFAQIIRWITSHNRKRCTKYFELRNKK
jgi:hypothetical protein